MCAWHTRIWPLACLIVPKLTPEQGHVLKDSVLYAELIKVHPSYCHTS